MRYRLRTLLIVVTAFGALCGVAHWWTTPYVIHRRSRSGKLTEEVTEDVWYRRTISNSLVQTGVVQYHANGKKASEFRYGDDSGHYLEGYPRYWLDDGTEVSREEF